MGKNRELMQAEATRRAAAERTGAEEDMRSAVSIGDRHDRRRSPAKLQLIQMIVGIVEVEIDKVEQERGQERNIFAGAPTAVPPGKAPAPPPLPPSDLAASPLDMGAAMNELERRRANLSKIKVIVSSSAAKKQATTAATRRRGAL